MKKLLSCLLTFCMLFGLGISNVYNSMCMEAKEISIVTKSTDYNDKDFDHVFTQEELKNTDYAGMHVEAKNGKLYVEGRIVKEIVVYYLIKGSWVVVGILANGTFQKTLDWYDLLSTDYDILSEVWQRYRDQVDRIRLNGSQNATVELNNGNVCVRQSANRYACKFEGTPDKPIVE